MKGVRREQALALERPFHAARGVVERLATGVVRDGRTPITSSPVERLAAVTMVGPDLAMADAVATGAAA